jgi:hypothetical protein
MEKVQNSNNTYINHHQKALGLVSVCGSSVTFLITIENKYFIFAILFHQRSQVSLTCNLCKLDDNMADDRGKISKSSNLCVTSTRTRI